MGKKVTLKRIKLSNWKSLNIDINLNEHKNIIKGKNGIGKTSIQSAWNWLWTGYCNPYSPKNSELFDNRVEISHETPIASVKVWIDINGIEYTIEKTAEAKFTRNRSKNEYVKANSDVYVTKIDEIEMSVTDFSEWIEHNLCDVDMLQYCLDGSFFTTLCQEDKKKGRKILERIVGEIKESDFTGDYSCLSNDFAKGYTIEQIEERVKNQIKPINDRIEKLPSIIEMKENDLASLKCIDFASIKKEIDARKNDIAEIDAVLLGHSQSIEPIIGQRNKIFDIINSKTLNLNERKNIYLSTFNSIRSKIKAEINSIQLDNGLIQSRNLAKRHENDKNKEKLEQVIGELEQQSEYREKLLVRKDEVKSRIFNEESCPYCKQELPYEMIEDARAKFNKQKQDDLDNIVSRGKATKTRIEQLTKEKEELELLLSKGVELEELKSIDTLESQLNAHEASYKPFEETEEYAKLSKEIDELKSSLPQLPENENAGLTNMKNVLMEDMEQLNRQYGKIELIDEYKKEIEKLRNEQKELGCEIAVLEGQLNKCKEYIEERANIISDRINTKLDNCYIEMFSIQKNGEQAPDCVIKSKNGVKNITINNAMRILTNIEIQNMFCKHYGLELITFIDEASIFDDENLPKLQKQCVYLYASNDISLMVEN